MSRAQAIAAAEKGAEVHISVHGVSYEAILALPWDEFVSTLAQGDYSDIQSFCKHLGLTAKGARAELERRITEHVKAQRESSDVHESPIGRGGRVRSPRPGNAASTVRAEAEKLDKEHKPRADTAPMEAEATRIFAFTGFPEHTDPSAALKYISEATAKFLGDFAVSILGVSSADGQIGISYPQSQGQAIHEKIHELRDTFVFGGVTLTTVDVDMLLMDKFKVPTPSGPAGLPDGVPVLPGGVSAPRDEHGLPHDQHGLPFAASKAGIGGGGFGSSGGRGGVQHLGGIGGAEVAGGGVSADQAVKGASIYQRFVMSSPKTQRSQGAHSGLTPQVDNTRQSVDDFLASAAPALPALAPPPPLPGNREMDPTLAAILEGVNELRAKAVSQEQLRDLYQLQRAEYQAFVEAETTPLHNAVGHITRDIVELQRGQVMDSDRIGRLETHLESGTSGNAPNPHDIAHRRVAFIGFPKESKVPQRIAAMEAFMAKHFADVRHGMIDLFPDKNGKETENGFVEFSDKKLVRRVLSAVKSGNLKVDDFRGVIVKRANTEIDRNRNWAIKTAERLIREHPSARGKTVEAKKGEGRGVYVDSVQVFSQEPRFSKDGTFHGAFATLKLRTE